MACRLFVAIAFVAIAFPIPISAQASAEKSDTLMSVVQLERAPFVSAKAWIVVDANNGKQIGGDNVSEVRPMASTTKIMTACIVLRLAAVDAKVLDEIVTYSD